MTRLLLWTASFVLSAIVTWRTAHHLAVFSPIRRINYRGLSVPTAAGIAVVLGVMVSTAMVALLSMLDRSSRRLADAREEMLLFAVVAAGYGLLGLWDDIAGRSEQRGWRAHVDAVRHGRATSGAIKLVGGAAFAVAVVARGDSIVWVLVGAAVLAMSANAFNLLDLRPGRSGKWFLLAMVAILFVEGPSVPPLAAAAGAVAAFLPFDLRERVMLGDSGAMAIGGMAGLAFVGSGHTVEVVALVMLVLMHVFADKPGLSEVIDTVPPLRIFDRAGRVPE